MGTKKMLTPEEEIERKCRMTSRERNRFNAWLNRQTDLRYYVNALNAGVEAFQASGKTVTLKEVKKVFPPEEYGCNIGLLQFIWDVNYNDCSYTARIFPIIHPDAVQAVHV